MNENIDLMKILNDCPKGWEFYSSIFGEVKFDHIVIGSRYPIVFITKQGTIGSTPADGRHLDSFEGECTLFPSKDQRDWSKFTAPWYKKEKFNPEKFDPKTLKPFDKVLTRDLVYEEWTCTLFSYRRNNRYSFICGNEPFVYCIPYNEDTKHLIGTTEEAPEYYRYWED